MEGREYSALFLRYCVLNVCLEAGYLAWVSWFSLIPSRQISEEYIKLGHDHFLSYSLHSIIHYSACHMALYNLVWAAESVVK
jgi:hypothetical protein